MKNGDLVFAIDENGKSFTDIYQNEINETRAIVKDDCEDLREVDKETVELVVEIK